MNIKKMLKYNLPGIYYLIVAFVIPYLAPFFGVILIDWSDHNFYTRGGLYGVFSTITGQIALIIQVIVWAVGGIMIFRRGKHEREDFKSLIPVVLQYFIIGSAIIVGVLSLVVYFLSKV